MVRVTVTGDKQKSVVCLMLKSLDQSWSPDISRLISDGLVLGLEASDLGFDVSGLVVSKPYVFLLAVPQFTNS